MGITTDLRTQYHLILAPIRGTSHAQRLESFYSSQAGNYDDFRHRLLQGRRELITELNFAPGEVWLDMGAGTGANLEFIAPLVPKLKQVYLVDLSPSLLSIARQRIVRHRWSNITPVQADVATFRPRCMADVITFSYSLTMIPDWIQTLLHARTILKPRGRIGLVDFYVSRKYPPEGWVRHPWSPRNFWPLWFQRDNVYLSPDHLPFLANLYQPRVIDEALAKVHTPYAMPTGHTNSQARQCAATLMVSPPSVGMMSASSRFLSISSLQTVLA